MALEHLSDQELQAIKNSGGDFSQVPTDVLQRFAAPSGQPYIQHNFEEGAQPLPAGFTIQEAQQMAPKGPLGGLQAIAKNIPSTPSQLEATAGLVGAGELLPAAAGAALKTKTGQEAAAGLGRVFAGLKEQTTKNIIKDPELLFRARQNFGEIYQQFLDKFGLKGATQGVADKAAEYGANISAKAGAPLTDFTNDTVGKVKAFSTPENMKETISATHEALSSLQKEASYRQAVLQHYNDNASAYRQLHESVNANLMPGQPANTEYLDRAVEASQAAAEEQQKMLQIRNKMNKIQDTIPNPQDVLTARHILSGQAKLPPLPETGTIGLKAPMDYAGLKHLDSYLENVLQLPEGQGIQVPGYGEVRNFGQAKQIYSEGATNKSLDSLLPKTESGKTSITRGMFTAAAGGAGGPAGAALAGMVQSPFVIKQLLKAGIRSPEALKALGALAPALGNSQQAGQDNAK